MDNASQIVLVGSANPCRVEPCGVSRRAEERPVPNLGTDESNSPLLNLSVDFNPMPPIDSQGPATEISVNGDTGWSWKEPGESPVSVVVWTVRPASTHTSVVHSRPSRRSLSLATCASSTKPPGARTTKDRHAGRAHNHTSNTPGAATLSTAVGGITLAKGTEHPTSAEPVARSVAISSVLLMKAADSFCPRPLVICREQASLPGRTDRSIGLPLDARKTSRARCRARLDVVGFIGNG